MTSRTSHVIQFFIMVRKLRNRGDADIRVLCHKTKSTFTLHIFRPIPRINFDVWVFLFKSDDYWIKFPTSQNTILYLGQNGEVYVFSNSWFRNFGSHRSRKHLGFVKYPEGEFSSFGSHDESKKPLGSFSNRNSEPNMRNGYVILRAQIHGTTSHKFNDDRY